MNKPEAQVVQSTQRASTFFVWLFAAVGFLASIVQIFSYLSGSGSDLQVRITPQRAALQQSILDAVDESSDVNGFLATSAEEDSKFFCDAAKATLSSSKEKSGIDLSCARYTAIKTLARMLRQYGEGNTTFLDYALENRGNSVASGLQLSSKDVFDVNISQNERFSKIDKNQGEGFYRIPDLNPGSRLNIRVWLQDYGRLSNQEYLGYDELPQITMRSGKPSVTVYKTVPSFYSDIYYFLKIFPTTVAVSLVIFFFVLVGILSIVIISAMEALFSGKPLSSIFKAAEGPQEADVGSSDGQKQPSDVAT